MPLPQILVPDQVAADKPSGGTAVASAIGEVAGAVTTGAAGIQGYMAKQFTQLTAISVVIGLCLWAVWRLDTTAREQAQSAAQQRQLDREERREMMGTLTSSIDRLNMAQQERWLKTDVTHSRSMERMGATIERAVTSLEKATEAMERKKDLP